VDDVNIHIDELVAGGDGRDGISSVAEQVRRVIPGPFADQVAASVDQAIGTAIGPGIT
jgi:hypothetical protein